VVPALSQRYGWDRVNRPPYT